MADKYAMFDRFARSLERLVPAIQGQYCCPLSLAMFQREAIEAGELTEEHCIPRGLGEPIFVLTSKRANNTAGSDIDAHLHRMIQHDEVFRDGVGTLRGRFIYGNCNVDADFTREISDAGTNNHFRISGDHRRSDVAQIETMQRFAKQVAETKNIDDEMTFKLHAHWLGNRQRARVAILKAGYLLLFRQFGYAYILDELLNAVRQQIASPDREILPINKIVFEMRPQDYNSRILLVTKPEEFMAYIVGIEMKKDNQANPRYFGVILPATTTTFENWKNAKAQTMNVAKIRNDIDYLENPRPFISK